MATELLQPGVSVIQEFRTVSPTIVRPTLVPCAVAPAFQILDALETDATGNKVVNADAIASVPAIINAGNPGVYSGLNAKKLKVSVNNGAPQEFTFSDPTSAGLSATKVKDQINASVPAPSGWAPYVRQVGSNYYLQLRSTNKGTGQLLKVLDGDSNSIFDFKDNFQASGVSSYQNYDVNVEQANFPDPRGIIDELDVDESTIRVFVNAGSSGGTNLKEFKRTESFLRKLKGATYTSGTLTYGAQTGKKFAFQYDKSGVTHEFTFASSPANIADLVTAMNTLVTALSGITFATNPDGTHLDAKSTYGYFKVCTPGTPSALSDLGWTADDEAFTVMSVDDGDGDSWTPYLTVPQENFNASAAAASLLGSVAITTELAIHNKTFAASLNGNFPQEITFNAGPIIAGTFSGTNTLNGEVFDFTVNGVSKSVTFTGTDPIAIASIISQINAAAGLTVCYEGDGSGVPTPGGGKLCFQVGGATASQGGEIVLVWSAGYTNQWTDLGLTPGASISQTMSKTEIINAINATFGGVFASAGTGNKILLSSAIKGDESKIAIGSGTANAQIGFTSGAVVNGTPFTPKPGDGIYVDGELIGYITVVMPGGYTTRLKLDREVDRTSFGGYAYYIEALNILAADAGVTRPTPDLVIDGGGAVVLKNDFLRDTEGNPISASGSLLISYHALRLDVSAMAATPGLLNIEDTTQLETALSPVNTENPLALMLYFMSINAPGVVVTGIGVDEVSSLNPDGTPDGYSRALSFLEAQEVYALAPASQDPVVHQLCMTHVDSMSDPDAKGERIVFINPMMPGEAIPVLVSSGTNGEGTGVTNEFDTKLPGLSADILAAGLDPTNLPVSAGLYLDIASDTYRYSVSAVSGTKVSIRVAFSPGENDDSFYAISNLPSGLLEESFTLYKRGEPLVDSMDKPDYQAIAQAYQDLGKTYANRRVIMVAPENVAANIDSTEQKVPGYYVCAAIAGMVGQLPPQQGFTNYPITGFARCFGSNDVFTNRQMNIGAAGGTYWVIQEVAGGPLTCRHQLTTDLTSIERRELSITKVVDFTAKFMRSGLRSFIGKFNITQPFLDTLSTVVQGQLSFLTESGVLIGGDLNNIIQDKSAPDTVLIDVTLDVPYPCNYIRLTLVI
jgi:hypothetical protein